MREEGTAPRAGMHGFDSHKQTILESFKQIVRKANIDNTTSD